MEEVVAGKMEGLASGGMEAVVAGLLKKLVLSESQNTSGLAMAVRGSSSAGLPDRMEERVREEVVAELERAMLATGYEEMDAYDIRIEKEKAAMRKEQKRSTEGGWMRCASCRKRGSLRCAGCFMTTYCGLECHEKDWGEGHRGRCRQVRKEFVKVFLDDDWDEEVFLEQSDWDDEDEEGEDEEGEDEEGEDETEAPLPYFTVKVQVSSIAGVIWVVSKDKIVWGVLGRPGQEEAYDQVKKVVEEQGLKEEVDDFGEKWSTACFFAHYLGKTEDGRHKLEMNIKRVQPFVKW